jgi:hypothetical protein
MNLTFAQCLSARLPRIRLAVAVGFQISDSTDQLLNPTVSHIKMIRDTSMKVPVLAKDDFEPFCIMKAVKTLSYLERVVDSVFSTISNRILQSQARVNSMTSRISSAQTAIEELNDPSKVITIISPLKFPGPERPTQYPPITQSMPRFAPEVVTSSSIVVTEALRNVVEDEDSSFEFERDPIIKPHQLRSANLGRSPADLNAMSSLLLFQTNENPYRMGTTIDNFEGKCGQASLAEKEKARIPAAPNSIFDVGVLPDIGDSEFMFRRQLGGAPPLELPDNIPGLVGIADLGFGIDDADMDIVPSLYNFEPSEGRGTNRQLTNELASTVVPPHGVDAEFPVLSSISPNPPPPPSRVIGATSDAGERGAPSSPETTTIPRSHPDERVQISASGRGEAMPPPPSFPVAAPQRASRRVTTPGELDQRTALSSVPDPVSHQPHTGRVAEGDQARRLEPPGALTRGQREVRANFLDLINRQTVTLKRVTMDDAPRAPESHMDEFTSRILQRGQAMAGNDVQERRRILDLPQAPPAEPAAILVRSPNGMVFAMPSHSDVDLDVSTDSPTSEWE